MSELTASIELKGIDKFSPELRKMSSRFRGFSQRLTAEGAKIGRVFSKIQQQNQGTIKALKRLSVVSGALATAGFYKTIRAGSEFGASMADLSAITGVAGKDLDFLREQSLKLAKDSVMPASQVAEAFKLVASAKSELLQDMGGFNEVTKQVLLLSNASGMNLASAATVATQAMNQFGLEAKDASRAVNVLAAGSKVGASEVNETGAAIVKSGVAARDAKVSFEEANSAIQVLAKGGIKGAEAGTMLRNVFMRLEKQGNKRFKPSVVGINEALENLAKANLDTAKKSKLFGDEAASAASILIRERGLLAKWTKEITGTGIANEQAAKRLDTFKKKMESFGIQIRISMIRVFQKLEPHLRKIVEKMRRFAESFDADKFARRIGKAISFIGKLIDKLGGLEGIANKAKIAMEGFLVFKGIQTALTLAPLLGTIATGTTAVGTAAAGAATGVGALSGAFTSLAAAAGAVSFVGTYKGLRALDKKFNGKGTNFANLALGPIGMGWSLYRKYKRKNRQAPRQSAYKEEQTAPYDEMGALTERLFPAPSPKPSQLWQKTKDGFANNPQIQELIGTMKTELKKQQKIQVQVQLSGDVGARVKSVLSSTADVTANTGNILPG